MAGIGKVVRLSKAAREFNISLDSIVGFLTNKGYSVERNPNAKLSPEMYDILSQEFHDEKEVKENAKHRGLEYVGKESISIDNNVPEEVKENDELQDYKPDDELIIKNIGVTPNNADNNTENKVDTPATTEDVNATAEEDVKKEEIPEVKEVPEEKDVSEVTKVPEVNVTPDSEVVSEEKVIEKEPAPSTETLNTEVSEPKDDTQETELHNEETITEETHTKESDDVKKTVVEQEEKTPEPDTSEDQKSDKTETDDSVHEEEESGEIKVLGKINLDEINQATRPKKKSRAERRKEREDKKKTPVKTQKTTNKEKTETKTTEKSDVEIKKPKTKQPLVTKEEPVVKKEDVKPENEKSDDNNQNFIKTKVEKLTGPKILDKIELPVEHKRTKGKKPVASSTDKKVGQNKKKRKRIKTQPQSGVDNAAATNKHQRSKHKKKPTKKKITKVEPTEEEIQQKIKDTLARLAPSGKSKASKHRRKKRDTVSQAMQEELIKQEEEKKILKVTEFVTANELANMMNVNVTDIITSCMQLGLFVSINQRLDAETLVLVAEEFGYQVNFVSVDDNESLEVIEEEDDPEKLIERSPIVTVMGHVDHGKTKLLDYIRNANVVAGEAGGITQHIGAYEVKTESGKKITFLDTPGHEAFTAMRARGAKITDVAIIVIAADDSVMPQTKEAINHAQAAGVPIVFAINKMDKPGANAEKVKEQLANMNILVEDWGGKYQSQEISAITGMGINELLEKVLLESEILDLKANPDKHSKGTVIEASLDKGRGYVTTILVQDGTLKKGDIILAGPVSGKVKAMFNERNEPVEEVGPSQPVLLLGLIAAPQAGDVFNTMKDEKEAKSLASKRQQLIREQSLRTQKHITLDEIGRRIAIGDFKEINIIVKGDVDGSIEALTDALIKQSTTEVQVNVIHKAVGAISESDVMLASASDAIIIGFQVRPSLQARRLAEKEQIDIRLYSIIYQATEELQTAIEGMLAPKTEEKITCNIEVRETFKITKVGTIAGCYVLDGKVNRNTKVRIIRDGIVIYTGTLGSLKRFKDDAKEVAAGYECGLNIENFNDIKVGDIIEGYEIVEVKR